MTHRERRIVGWVVSIIASLLILECAGFEEPLFFVVNFLGGWIQFLIRVIPAMELKPAMILSTFVYATALIGGSHLFLRWLYRNTNGDRWRMQWTLSGAAMILILFAAGLSSVGVMDHAGKLIASTQPLFKPNRDRVRADIAKCGSNLHVIGLAIQLYQQDNAGYYPADLSCLLRDEQITSTVFICPASKDQAVDGSATQQVQNLLTPGHCSYIFVGKGLVGTVAADKVVAYEPLENHQGDGIHVLYGDGHVDWLDRPKAMGLLDRLKVPAATTSP